MTKKEIVEVLDAIEDLRAVLSFIWDNICNTDAPLGLNVNATLNCIQATIVNLTRFMS